MNNVHRAWYNSTIEIKRRGDCGDLRSIDERLLWQRLFVNQSCTLAQITY